MQSSWLDRALGAVAPRAALSRARARAELARLDGARKYTGAALGRVNEGWITANSSADAEIQSAGSRLRDRARDLVRNNPHAAKALSSWESSIVGDGITPRSPDKRALALFQDWARQCDADGQLDFYGLQRLACREMVEAGEVLLRRRRRAPGDGMAVPLQLQLIEADLLDDARTGPVPGSGNTAILGVEFDRIGRRTAYWLYAQHPGAIALVTNLRLQSAAVPAADVIHLYEKQRTQVRGASWFAPVIGKLRHLDDWLHAELMRKKLTACHVGVVTTVDEDDTQVGAVRIEDADGNPVDRFEPGTFVIARGGKDVKFNTPASDEGAADYVKASLKDVAAGMRLPYELLSGDLSEVNFSSMRAGLNEFRRLVRSMQYLLFIPIFCQRAWDWFIEAAFLAGRLDQPVVPVRWIAPRFEWVDPLKDVQADKEAIRAGLLTWDDAVHERGGDPDEQQAEIVARNKQFDAQGVVLDIDPRADKAAAPAAQAAAPPGRDEDEDDSEPPPPRLIAFGR